MFLKLLTLGSVLAIFFSGCGLKTPSPNATIDDSLPVISMSANPVIVDSGSIAIEWQVVNDPRVEGIFVYRAVNGEAINSAKNYIDTIPNRFSTHYVDTKIEPSTQYNYYFRAYSKDHESRDSSIISATSMPQMESVSWIHATGGMPRAVKILWRPHPNEKVKGYVIERRTLQNDKWSKIATVNGRLSVEYLDEKLEDKFTYIYRIKALAYDGKLSLPSSEVSVSTKPLPPEVQSIRATSDLPRSIRIDWDYVPNEDFLTYRLYRSKSVDGSFEALADTKNNFYVDNVNDDAKEYFYRVGVFDKDKLESDSSKFTALGKTLIKPAAPSITEARVVDGRVKISWISVDPRAKSFLVEKKHKKNLFDNKITQVKGITSNEFYDSYIQGGETYIYKVYAVDNNGIKSEPSIDITLKIKSDVTSQQAPAIMPQTESNPTQNVTIPRSTQDLKLGEPAEEIVTPLNDF